MKQTLLRIDQKIKFPQKDKIIQRLFYSDRKKFVSTKKSVNFNWFRFKEWKEGTKEQNFYVFDN